MLTAQIGTVSLSLACLLNCALPAPSTIRRDLGVRPQVSIDSVVLALGESPTYDEALGDLTISDGPAVLSLRRTYDQAFGDAPIGNGDPTLVRFGKSATPRIHEFATKFIQLDNFRACPQGNGLEEDISDLAVGCRQHGIVAHVGTLALDGGRLQTSGKKHLWIVRIKSIPSDSPDRAVGELDRRLGEVVDLWSARQDWSHTAVFFLPWSVSGNDHVDKNRAVALIVSPWARMGFLNRSLCTTEDILLTIKHVLGITKFPLTEGQKAVLRCFKQGVVDR